MFFVSFLLVFINNLYGNDSILKAGMKIEKKISSSEEHIYTAELNNGDAILAELIQQGIDLVIDVYKPNGKILKQIDSPNGKNGLEPIDITADLNGKYQFIVRSLDKSAGKAKYTLKVLKFLNVRENAERIARKEISSNAMYQLWLNFQKDETVIDKFFANESQRHIIEPIEGNNEEMLVTYFTIPDENTEYVMQSGGPDFLGLRFKQLGRTKLFYVSQRVPVNARFNYGFNYFRVFRAGPQAEVEQRDVFHAYDGTVVMPAAEEQSFILAKETIAKGKLDVLTIESSFLNETRKITTYTPAGYKPGEQYDLLIVFDGEAYGGRPKRRARVSAPTILDNLIAEKKIKPTVMILVWSMRGRSRLLISDNFSKFIAKELIPWARKNYTISNSSSNIILAGSSRGGFAAANIAFQYPGAIGNVLSMSGSYWIKGTKDENHWTYPKDSGKLIKAYKQSKKLPIRFYMEIGLYDAGASMLGSNRALRDILEVKGYHVDYKEFNGGHEYVNWRASLANGLMTLLNPGKN